VGIGGVTSPYLTRGMESFATLDLSSPVEYGAEPRQKTIKRV